MGFLRLFLALSVITGHAESTVFGFMGLNAGYAVNLFFIISGFYMAMVLNEKYHDKPAVSFYKSRLLRLAPAYYIGLLLAILVSHDVIATFFNGLTLSSKIYYIIQNTIILGQGSAYVFCAKNIYGLCSDPVGLTINPPAWSLAIEIMFYLIAPYIVKSVKKTVIFFLVGSIYLVCVAELISFPVVGVKYLQIADIVRYAYYFYPSSMIFFGSGALAYHFSKSGTIAHPYLILTSILLLSFSYTVMPFWHVLFIALAIPLLFKITSKNKVDRMIGELSYPVYIFHFPIVILMQKIEKSNPDFFEYLSVGSVVAIISSAMGILVYWFIERRVDRYRHSITDSAIEDTQSSRGTLYYALMAAYFVIPFILVAHIVLAQRP